MDSASLKSFIGLTPGVNFTICQYFNAKRPSFQFHEIMFAFKFVIRCHCTTKVVVLSCTLAVLYFFGPIVFRFYKFFANFGNSLFTLLSLQHLALIL